MNRIYKPYWEWEDYLNGMYDTKLKEDENILISNVFKILTNEELFFKTSLKMIYEWKISASVNLTNKSINRLAWIGQAACSYKYNVPEIITKKTWKLLANKQQLNANKIANKIVIQYEKNYYRLYSNMGKKMLSLWDT